MCCDCSDKERETTDLFDFGGKSEISLPQALGFLAQEQHLNSLAPEFGLSARVYQLHEFVSGIMRQASLIDILFSIEIFLSYTNIPLKRPALIELETTYNEAS
jgi:hypothetical protein